MLNESIIIGKPSTGKTKLCYYLAYKLVQPSRNDS